MKPEIYDRLTTSGADGATVVEEFLFIAHETGMPARSKTGRLLVSLTAKPEALLLAERAVQMDGRYQEAWEILEPLHNNQMFQNES